MILFFVTNPLIANSSSKTYKNRLAKTKKTKKMKEDERINV